MIESDAARSFHLRRLQDLPALDADATLARAWNDGRLYRAAAPAGARVAIDTTTPSSATAIFGADGVALPDADGRWTVDTAGPQVVRVLPPEAGDRLRLRLGARPDTTMAADGDGVLRATTDFQDDPAVHVLSLDAAAVVAVEGLGNGRLELVAPDGTVRQINSNENLLQLSAGDWTLRWTRTTEASMVVQPLADIPRLTMLERTVLPDTDRGRFVRLALAVGQQARFFDGTREVTPTALWRIDADGNLLGEASRSDPAAIAGDVIAFLAPGTESSLTPIPAQGARPEPPIVTADVAPGTLVTRSPGTDGTLLRDRFEVAADGWIAPDAIAADSGLRMRLVDPDGTVIHEGNWSDFNASTFRDAPGPWRASAGTWIVETWQPFGTTPLEVSYALRLEEAPTVLGAVMQGEVPDEGHGAVLHVVDLDAPAVVRPQWVRPGGAPDFSGIATILGPDGSEMWSGGGNSDGPVVVLPTAGRYVIRIDGNVSADPLRNPGTENYALQLTDLTRAADPGAAEIDFTTPGWDFATQTVRGTDGRVVQVDGQDVYRLAGLADTDTDTETWILPAFAMEGRLDRHEVSLDWRAEPSVTDAAGGTFVMAWLPLAAAGAGGVVPEALLADRAQAPRSAGRLTLEIDMARNRIEVTHLRRQPGSTTVDTRVDAFDIPAATADLSVAAFRQLDAVLAADGDGARLTLSLGQGADSVVLIDGHALPGFVIEDLRLAFGARVGSATANHDIAAIRVARSDWTGADLPLGDTVLSHPGGEALSRWTFGVDADTTVFLDRISGTATYYLKKQGEPDRLARPLDPVSTSFVSGEPDPPALRLSPGRYELIATTNRFGTTDHSFRLVDLSALPQAGLGAASNVTLDPGARAGGVTFDLAAGQPFGIEVTDGALTRDVSAVVIGPDGSVVARNRGDMAFHRLVAERAGTYAVLWDRTDGTTEPHSLTAVVHDLTAGGGALALGGTTTGPALAPAARSRHGFTLAQESLLHFDTLSGGAEHSWRIFDADGALRAEGTATANAQPLAALGPGDYVLEIVRDARTAERLEFVLANMTDAPALEPDVAQALTAAAEGAALRARVALQDGQGYTIEGLSQEDARWWLTDDAGRIVSSGVGPAPARRIDIGATGTYHLIVDAPDATETAELRLRTVPQTLPIALGERVEMAFDGAGQVRETAFTLTDDSTRVVIDTLLAGVRAEVALIGPDGTTRATWDLDASSFGTLEESPLVLGPGTWRVVVTAEPNTGFNPPPVQGQIALRVLDTANAVALTDDGRVEGRLDPGSLADLYSFDGTAGQAVSFTFDESQRDTRAFLWSPAGERIALLSASGASGEVTLSETGRYLLVVRGDAQAAGGVRSYTLTGHLDLTDPDRPIPISRQGDGPDLSVRDLAITGDALSGAPLEITWRSANLGTEPAVGQLSERVEILDAGGAVRATLAVPLDLSASPLAAGAARARSAEITLPADLQGDITVRVTTDAGQALEERNSDGTAETNNVANIAAVATVPSFPNLVVEQLSGPDFDLWQPGQTVNLSYTVGNTGDAAAEPGWTERLSLLDRVTGQIVRSIDVAVTERLDAGASATRQVALVVPDAAISGFELSLSLDTADVVDERADAVDAESDNTDLLRFVAAPDLTVTGLRIDGALRVGEPVVVEWTTSNVGTLPAGAHLDRVEISYRNAVSSPLVTATVSRDGLAPDAQAQNRVTLDLPVGADPREMRVRVVTNAGTPAVTEVTVNSSERHETNSARLDRVALPPLRADLRLDAPVAPPTASVGDTIDVSWQVENAGPVETRSDAWVDELWLSRDATPGDPDDILLARVPRAGALGAGGTYQAAAEVVVPQAGGGDWQLVVITDADAALDEPGTRGDNISPATAIVLSAPAADLSVGDVSVSRTRLFAGEQLEVGWRVTNAGPDAAPAGSLDRILISATGDIADAVLLAEIASQAPLAAGDSILRSRNVTLPGGLSGALTLFVVTNADGRVGEGPNGADNNTAEAPTELAVASRAAADLVVSDVLRPDGLTAGVPFDLSYTVRNAGSVAALGPWRDRIQLIDPATGQSLGDLGTFRRDASLAPGESYRAEVRITPPRLLRDGPVLLRVIADVEDAVFEAGLEASNVEDGTPLPAGAPDLSVAVSGPATARAGQEITLDWTITNDGARPAIGSFVDRIWLSPTDDPADGRLLAEVVTDAGGLAPGESLAVARRVTLPADMAGPLRLILGVNDDASLTEAGGPPDHAITPIEITAIAQPDLVVAEVTAPPLVYGAIATFEVSWRVENRGTGTGTGAAYTDAVRLVEAGSGRIVPLGTFTRTGPPAPGEGYTETASFTVQNLSGDWRVEVATDVDDTLYEDGAGANVAGTPVGFAARPYADLAVTRVDAPESASGGDTITVGWRIENVGDESAPLNPGGRTAVRDRIEVRRVSDGALLTSRSVDRFGQLAPGDAVERVETLTLPDYADGDYEIVVRTDPEGRVYEHTALANNRLARALTIAGRPLPNLAVDAFEVDPAADEGGFVEFGWTVRSTGPGVADGTWRVAISDEATGRVLWSGTEQGTLPPGTTQERREIVALPEGLVGERAVVLTLIPAPMPTAPTWLRRRASIPSSTTPPRPS
ncbi:CARDB protein [Palleronia salina]|uniref:CARDB protein n=1 Tax=Palleronia salina TaxID=313368 RepID=A0A1M6KN44_9RHOB|nr:CARDB domain-containing protein [Palleronia salina]SHJ60428.1 CARDB protein [Palleronia salina]